MSLVKCPECKKKISDKASVCPRCGYPIMEESCLAKQKSKRISISKKTLLKPFALFTNTSKKLVDNMIWSASDSFSNFTNRYKRNLTAINIILAITMAFVPTYFSIYNFSSRDFLLFHISNHHVLIIVCLVSAITTFLLFFTDWHIARLIVTFFLLLSALFAFMEFPKVLCIFFAIETIIYVYFNPLKKR